MPLVRNKPYTFTCDECDKSEDWEGGKRRESIPRGWLVVLTEESTRRQYLDINGLAPKNTTPSLAFCGWRCLALFAANEVRERGLEQHEIPWVTETVEQVVVQVPPSEPAPQVEFGWVQETMARRERGEA